MDEVRTISPSLDTVVPPRGTALVVDDEPANCRLLSRMLQKEGFRTIEAHDGEAALALFAADRPDIVFMDVMMPLLNGFDATRQIKAMAGLDFIPVIFLTALRDEQSLIRCIESGGDDFLSKPFDFGVLKARISAMERVRNLQRVIAAKNQELSVVLERDRAEQALAERVFRRAVNNHHATLDRLGLVQRPASIFNGDLVLARHLPDGALRLLFGDFTGHGLAAAIGALPVADAFHAMTRKGADDSILLAELNRKLYQMLPPDRFMAACLVTIAPDGSELQWWNGGMPSAWLRTAGELRELASHSLPLGILADLPPQEAPLRIPLRSGDRMLLMSDGLLEAEDASGRMFVDHGFKTILSGWNHGESILTPMLEALDAHCGASEQTDDVALLEIPLDSPVLRIDDDAPPDVIIDGTHPGGWSWSLELRNERLSPLPPIAEALQPLDASGALSPHLRTIETIIVELYANALDHGILRLESTMKSTPEGFEHYYTERDRRLRAGYVGWIRLRLDYEPHGSGGNLRIQVQDSGSGFDPATLSKVPDPAHPWGRGIAMVRGLCGNLRFLDRGTCVEALYHVGAA